MHVTSTRALGAVAAALCWAMATVLAGVALRDPGHVATLTLANPHEWAVNAEVSDAARADWVGLGGIDRGDEHTFELVLDQGDTWVIRFAYAGHHADVEVSRSHLERTRWRVSVPDQLATDLRRAGVLETPRH